VTNAVANYTESLMPIFEGNLLGSDGGQPEEYGLLKEGQYTEEHKEY